MTVFEPRGDKAYVDGFFLIKGKGETSAVRVPMILPADHQRTRPVEVVRDPEVVSGWRKTGGWVAKRRRRRSCNHDNALFQPQIFTFGHMRKCANCRCTKVRTAEIAFLRSLSTMLTFIRWSRISIAQRL